MDLGEHGSLVQALVRDWVEQEYPGEPGLAGRAALVAAIAHEQGSSDADAFAAAHDMVRSWRNHPAHARPRRAALTLLAS